MAPGELHALVGQNGSGKSTLIKILTGYHAPDAGSRMLIDEAEVALPISAAERRRHGLSVVHQSLGLVESRTVTENLRLGRLEATRFGRRVRWSAERQAAAAVLARLGSAVRPTALVGDLSAEDRATVAIGRALQDHRPGRGLIVFDESTRALTRDALTRFYAQLRRVMADGASVLMISHRLEEVLDHADRVSVLRDGELVLAGAGTGDTSEAELTRAMLGRSISVARQQGDAGNPPDSATAVRVRDLEGVDLEIRRGEIVGVTGLVGSGYERIPYLLAGTAAVRSGTLTIGARTFALPETSPVALMKAGVALIPEDRVQQGLALGLSVRQNITVPRLTAVGRAWWTGTAWQTAEVDEFVGALDIRPPDPEVPVGSLSGGNQQKVLLAKWLAGRPELLLLHEPTQAVDVGARQDIVAALRRLAATGSALLVAASDPQELAILCDRVLVIRDGRIAVELTGEIDQDDIVDATFAREFDPSASRRSS
ncbi:sugar ABC transporter ATP-binding protein [Paractinoplanes toevensis]|uniref:Sugar ABC transporter ATP-binding protein n=1 Tax=Paractinoplanes toevensis TaxID=571911 RepID=A0A919W147_9ACTN|nr:sugar ABC transporter ATP-binding protein [Actinoplanes toevensis]